jgi:hypothetical protein
VDVAPSPLLQPDKTTVARRPGTAQLIARPLPHFRIFRKPPQMSPPVLTPTSADALLFDLGRVVLDIDFSRALTCWAGHAGCEPAQLIGRFSPDDAYKRHERGEISDAEFSASRSPTRSFSKAGTRSSPAKCRRSQVYWRGRRGGCRFMLSPTPIAPTKRIFRGPLRKCSGISGKCFCPRQSGFGNPTRQPMILW